MKDQIVCKDKITSAKEQGTWLIEAIWCISFHLES